MGRDGRDLEPVVLDMALVGLDFALVPLNLDFLLTWELRLT